MHTHLIKDDRIQLSALLKSGLSIRACSKQLGFSPPGISKEISKNGGRKKYNPYNAHKRYLEQRNEANQCHRKIGRDQKLTDKVLELLGKDWSPEQIVGRMLLEWGFVLTSATSIYNYVNPRKELHVLLPRKCNKYRRTRAGNLRKVFRAEISNKKSIDSRPEIVTNRERIGDWEGDTIVGKERTARMLTDVDRKSGYLLSDLLLKVTAELIRESQVKLFKPIPRSKKHTLTQDNGMELSEYELLEKECKIDIYHANAYHSWERGTSENTNGLVRRYFPKGTVFSTIDPRYFKKVINKINHRPRKRLGYKTPYEVFHGVNIRTLI
ncbi:MAG: IS30 family transposase [bacterium]